MSTFTKKHVLVTGAAGLIGHSVVSRLLSEGAFVRATIFKNRKLNTTHKNLEVVQCDLMDMKDCEAVVKDADVVINAVAHVRGAGGQLIDPTSLVRNNIFPMINMIDASIRERVDLFACIGSSTMYPDVSYPVLENEGFDGDPHKSYEGVGWVKRYCEKMCMHYHNITKTRFAIIRTTAVYGPNDNFHPDRSHVIPDLIMKANRKENPFQIWGDGNQVRDFIYVDDFVDGMLVVMEKHAMADPINIASGEATTVRQLVNLIAQKSGYSPTFVYDLSKPIAIPIRLVNTEKAKSILGWTATTELELGLEKTINWYNENIINKS